MSDKTGIEWTDATWNPTFDVVTRSEEKLYAPMRWRRPRRVFVNSMSDLFHEDVPDGFIARVWNVMAQCPQHTFQILTKRHARMRSWVTRWADRAGDNEVGDPNSLPPMPRGPAAVRATYTSGRALLFADMLDEMGDPPEGCAYPLYDWMEGQRWWPAVLPNVWLGVSVEDQHWADIRIPALLGTPAAVRWLSCEPLIGPIDLHAKDDGLDHWLPDFGPEYDDGSGEPVCQAHGISQCGQGCAFIDWLVVGGESGPGARPMHPDWARSLRDQCADSSVPFFFKQWGGRTPKDRGRMLDGRTWDEYPRSGGPE